MDQIRINIITALLSFNFRISQISVTKYQQCLKWELIPEHDMKFSRFLRNKKTFLNYISVIEPQIEIDREKNIIILTHKH